MPTDQSQTVSLTCEPPSSRPAQPCPACGAALVPLRGQWRCSRCYFTWCAGCEAVGGHEPAGADD